MGRPRLRAASRRFEVRASPAVRGRGAAEHLVEAAAGAVRQRAGQGVEGVEAGRDDLERRRPRRALAGAAGDEEDDVVAAVADRVPVDVEERGRAGEHQVALLARLALGRLAAGLAEVDRAAGQVQVGQVGVADQEHPVALVERQQPHPEAELGPHQVRDPDGGVAEPDVGRSEQPSHRRAPAATASAPRSAPAPSSSAGR